MMINQIQRFGVMDIPEEIFAYLTKRMEVSICGVT